MLTFSLARRYSTFIAEKADSIFIQNENSAEDITSIIWTINPGKVNSWKRWIFKSEKADYNLRWNMNIWIKPKKAFIIIPSTISWRRIIFSC